MHCTIFWMKPALTLLRKGIQDATLLTEQLSGKVSLPTNCEDSFAELNIQ